MTATLYYSKTTKENNEKRMSNYCGEVCYYKGERLEEGYYLCNESEHTEYKTHPIPLDSIRIGVEYEEVKHEQRATLKHLKICGENGFLGKTLEEVKSKLENLA